MCLYKLIISIKINSNRCPSGLANVPFAHVVHVLLLNLGWSDGDDDVYKEPSRRDSAKVQHLVIYEEK